MVADLAAEGIPAIDAGEIREGFVNLKERRTAMDMTSAQTFRYSISDVGCP